MNVNKTETPEDQREISLNETSLKRPLDVVDVIGGHGPWQFRQWIVFSTSSLCNSMILFSALFLPLQFCYVENSTVSVHREDHTKANSTTQLPEVRNYIRSNQSTDHLLSGCNSTDCEAPANGSDSVALSEFFGCAQYWNPQDEIFAKCVFIVACAVSGVLVYFSVSRFGSRPVALVSCVFLVASSVAISWADFVVLFLIMRFILAFGAMNIYLITALSLMKYVYKEYKILYFLTGHIGWGMAHFLLPLVAWLAKDWRSFNLSLSVFCMLLAILVWWSPEFPSLPIKGHPTRTRKALKYAAFTNGYSTTDVDLLSHSFHLRQENKHESGTPLSPKKKALWIFYSCLLFLISFTTTFLYFAAKWHTEWFKVRSDKISFAFLGTIEVACTIILLFLTCLVSVKNLWICVSVMSSAMMIAMYTRSTKGLSSSSMLYTVTMFFAASSWTLVLVKCFCHKISSATAKLNLIITSAAMFAGALIASTVVLKANNQDLLLIVGVPHLIFGASMIIIPDEYFGTITE